MNLNNQIEELRFLNDDMKVKSNMEIDQIKSKEKTDQQFVSMLEQNFN